MQLTITTFVSLNLSLILLTLALSPLVVAIYDSPCNSKRTSTNVQERDVKVRRALGMSIVKSRYADVDTIVLPKRDDDRTEKRDEEPVEIIERMEEDAKERWEWREEVEGRGGGKNG